MVRDAYYWVSGIFIILTLLGLREMHKFNKTQIEIRDYLKGMQPKEPTKP